MKVYFFALHNVHKRIHRRTHIVEEHTPILPTGDKRLLTLVVVMVVRSLRST